jgi:hypothetical protein
MTHCVEAIRKRRDLIEGLWALDDGGFPWVGVMPHMIISITLLLPLSFRYEYR